MVEVYKVINGLQKIDRMFFAPPIIVTLWGSNKMNSYINFGTEDYFFMQCN